MTDPVTRLLGELAGVTDRLMTAVSDADPQRLRMATAGSLLAPTDRLTAVVVQVCRL